MCKLRACECGFCPGITEEIEDFVSNCKLDGKESQVNKEVPSRPWQVVAADILHFQVREYLLVVDAYSKYLECSHLQNF
ncbi:hypothetical protein PR048_002287 [Dryococelus australis]|uniref:Uncharacterized protein n=1 Tax=Dryococelus australis TaxID=614101 RepID=A0ABQ9IJS2_9NEOP|nr:hypothetical protein PR048_002287 [Dryococelus australis]